MILKAARSQPLATYSFHRNSMKKFLSILFSTGFYTGYIPVAPGTIGSVLGLIIASLVGLLHWKIQLALFIVTFLLSIYAIRTTLNFFGKKDPPQVVIDEILGIWITVIFFKTSLKIFLLGFIFFRIFDILKPFPVGFIDRKIGGEMGIILDDIAAGLMAKGLIWIIFYKEALI